jgi:hypothetical protein
MTLKNTKKIYVGSFRNYTADDRKTFNHNKRIFRKHLEKLIIVDKSKKLSKVFTCTKKQEMIKEFIFLLLGKGQIDIFKKYPDDSDYERCGYDDTPDVGNKEYNRQHIANEIKKMLDDKRVFKNQISWYEELMGDDIDYLIEYHYKVEPKDSDEIEGETIVYKPKK